MAEGTTVPSSSAYEKHHIICGLNALGLAEHPHALGEQVVVMRSQANPAYESAVSALGVPILDGGPDDELALTRAGIDRAQAMALVADDDLGVSAPSVISDGKPERPEECWDLHVRVRTFARVPSRWSSISPDRSLAEHPRVTANA